MDDSNLTQIEAHLNGTSSLCEYFGEYVACLSFMGEEIYYVKSIQDQLTKSQMQLNLS